MIYQDFCTIIFKSYTICLEITLLQETFDFRRFALDPPTIVINFLQNIIFSHQFRIKFANKDDQVPRM
jgi:hypothetical protein